MIENASNAPKFSVIIAYYKNVSALSLIMKGFAAQSCQNFEIIVAEDDSKSDFSELQFHLLPFRVNHVFQERDIGFRKNEILNQAIKVANGKFIVFVDGDCIPHKHFIKSYQRHADENHILFGRRVMLSPELTSKLYQDKNIGSLTPFQIIKSGSKRLKYLWYLPFIKQEKKSGIWGHNWCVSKLPLEAINGFDEDYQKAGVGEDVDIEYRLLRSGLKLYSIRFAALQYHLDHHVHYTDDDVQAGMEMFRKKQEIGLVRCKNGLIKE